MGNLVIENFELRLGTPSIRSERNEERSMVTQKSRGNMSDTLREERQATCGDESPIKAAVNRS